MAYAELHCRSAFSFLDGASSPEELIRTAQTVGLPALALTDVNGLYGVVEAREALLEVFDLPHRHDERRSGLQLIYGSELSIGDDVAVALVGELEGYRNLCRSISAGRLAAQKGEFALSRDQFCLNAQGLFVLAGGPRSAAMRMLATGDRDSAARRLLDFREAFGDRLFVELVRQQAPGDREKSLAMAKLAMQLGLPVVASNDVHFHHEQRKPLHDVLRCIQRGCTLADAGRNLLPNSEAHLKSPAQMAELFSDLPEAVERSSDLARSIRFRLCDVTYSYPAPDLAPGENADQRLAQLAREGLARRLGALAAQYEKRLSEELSLISELQYAGYFLTMWDVINVCAEKNILCQGRGSAANSLVCFALGITSVDPRTIDMLFERFLSRERHEPPDIDLDIEHERREEIIQYVYRKYGRDHAGMVSEVIRYRRRSAVREVGKVLGFSEAQLLRMSRFLSHYWDELDDRALRSAGLDPTSPAVQRLLSIAQQMDGIPRHLSIHVGGFVLSREPLSDTVPLENGRMQDRTVIQWNKDDVDAMGMFKLDLLGLGMLTVLAKAFALVPAVEGRKLTLQTVPSEDRATYEMLQKADSVGVFQVESRAQMNMLPRLKPEKFYDLVIEVAIVRPGPIQGQMVHPYLRRKHGKETVDYPHPSLYKILHRTLGVPLFQEQVMRLAEAVGGYTAGQADQLRRDMASWRSAGKMERHQERLLAGMRANGLGEEFAQRVFQQIKGFGSYGFPESHAAAFAYLAYVSAYLKCHYPAEFAAALINSQPMGFYSPLVIVNDLKRHGYGVLPSDVQQSDWDCTLEKGALRLGLRMVHGLGEDSGRAIERARKTGVAFSSIDDLSRRAELPSKALVPLAAAGALASLHERREAIWAAAAIAQPLGPLLAGAPVPEGDAELPALEPLEELALDARYAGAFPRQHPMELLREALAQKQIWRACDVAHATKDEQVTVAGLVITRQRPGSGKIIYVTLEDETGHVDVSLTETKFSEFQDVVRSAGALIVRGRVMTDGNAWNVSAIDVAPLRVRANVPSHDFH